MVLDAAVNVLLRRDGESSGQKLVDLLKDPYADTLSAASMYSALGISLGFTAFTAIAFSLIRPYHQAIYAPKMKHADEKHLPPPLGKAPWSWVMTMWNTKEENLVPIIGMDATIFLRFVRMCRNMFFCLCVVGVGILVPVHWTMRTSASLGTSTSKGKNSDSAWVSKITPLGTKPGAMWAQVVVSWLFNIIIAGFLWWNYKKVLYLRTKYFESEEFQKSLHSRTLMLFDIPKKGRSDEGIARIIDQVAPNSSFARTAVARDVKELPKLIAAHDSAVRKLEKVLAKYLKDPGQLPPSRPMCKPSRRDRLYDTYPKGQKVDAIEYYTQRIRDLEVEVREVRASVDKRGTMSYGFASYSDIAEAHSIAYAARKKRTVGTTIKLAPRPNDIIWDNMHLSSGSRSRRRWWNTFWIIILTFFWIAPNAMIAIFLVNLNNLGSVWKGFNDSLNKDAEFWGAAQGIISPALMSLVYLVLPMIFRRLYIRSGDQTKTGRERHVLGKLYAFFVFNNLVVFSIYSPCWNFITSVIKDTSNGEDALKAILRNNIAKTLLTSLCLNSPFWVTYLLQRQLGAAIDLAQLWPLIQGFFLKKFSSPTPRELIELTAPPPFEYSPYYNYFLYYATVAMCFAGIQPLVLPATALYFGIDWYLKKYLLLYRFVTKTESGGMFWRVVFNRFIFGCMFSNLIVLLTCWVQGDGTHVQFYACCPLPFLMFAFKFYCGRVFDDKIRYYSTTTVNHNAEQGNQKVDRLRSERLASRFGHPALYKPLITPMVHSKAQNMLPAVYKGRLTDGREVDAGDLGTVSGYSDMYALDSMQGGRPGKAANGNIPGFEYVSESQLDFEYYKNRAEFAEDHGGGEIYGAPGEIMRPGTPGSVDSDMLSRPGTPGGRSTPFALGKKEGYRAPSISSTYSGFTPQPTAGADIHRNRSPLYSHDNDSSSGLGLIGNAAANPISAPVSLRQAEHGRMSPIPASPAPTPSPGPMGVPGSGRRGYQGVPQNEGDNGASDGGEYDYFRSNKRMSRRPGEGWQ